MKCLFFPGLVAGTALMAGSTALFAVNIPIPNGDFMLPDASAYPFANPSIPAGSWQKAAPPAWWAGSGTADQWNQASGVFYNVPGLTPDTRITNLTNSSQAAFLFAYPGNTLYQDLTTKYEVGKSYHLDFGLIASDANTPYAGAINPGSSIDFVLYYHDPKDNNNPKPFWTFRVVDSLIEQDPIVDLGSRLVTYQCSNLATDRTVMTNFPLSAFPFATPPILSADPLTDPWTGQDIGLQIITTADFSNYGGVWDVGNLQLSAVPEPVTMAWLAPAIFVLLRRRK